VFTTATTLQRFDHECEEIIDTDTSHYVSAGVESQPADEGVLHPGAYSTKKHSPAGWNYDIYDNMLMAIIKALKERRPECECAAYPLQLITDHKNLHYFVSKKLLNQWHARWSESLTRCDYEIVY